MLAQINIPLPSGLTGLPVNLSDSNLFLGTLVSRILLFGISLAGLYFFVRLISVGYRLLTAQGDPGKIQGATQEFVTSFTGLILVVSAFFIVQVIQGILGITIL